MAEDYQFDDVDTSVTATETPTESTGEAQAASTTTTSSHSGGGNGGYASELFSKQIKAKFRTFYIDLKESSNGKFVKISEKSHGRKSTIMMDGEDVEQFIEALQEVKGQL